MKYIQSAYWILWKKIFKSFPLKNINVNVYSFLGKHDRIIFISNTNKSFKIKSELLVICSILYLYFILNVYSFIKLKFQIPKSVDNNPLCGLPVQFVLTKYPCVGIVPPEKFCSFAGQSVRSLSNWGQLKAHVWNSHSLLFASKSSFANATAH